MSMVSSVSVAVSMTMMKTCGSMSGAVVQPGSSRLATLGGGEGEGAGRHRTITSYFVVITSVCSLLSNGMSRMRMSNESPPDPMACHSGVGVAWNTLVPDDDVAMILKTIYSSTSKEDLAG